MLLQAPLENKWRTVDLRLSSRTRLAEVSRRQRKLLQAQRQRMNTDECVLWIASSNPSSQRPLLAIGSREGPKFAPAVLPVRVALFPQLERTPHRVVLVRRHH